MSIDSERNRQNQVIAAAHALQKERRPIPEQRRQSALEIVQSVAGGRRFKLESRARIRNFDAESAIRSSPGNANLTTRAIGRDGVLYAVLHQRLERQRRNSGFVQVGGNIDLIAQAVAKAGAFDFQIIGRRS